MVLLVTFLYAAGAVVCHQLPQRSFFIDGVQLPVCARCTGLYLGGLAGLLAWVAWKSARGWRPIAVESGAALRLVAIAALPTVVTVATAISGIFDGTNMTRAMLAAPLGASAGAVVAAVLTKDLR